MKTYTITVNGNVYDVTVEEGGAGSAPSTVAPAARAVSAPKAAPAAPAPAPKKPAAGAQGGVKVNAPMPGKILAVKANPGQAVKKGQVILILEAMKMENEVVAPSDGTVASINVGVGDMVESGDVLASMN